MLNNSISRIFQAIEDRLTRFQRIPLDEDAIDDRILA